MFSTSFWVSPPFEYDFYIINYISKVLIKNLIISSMLRNIVRKCRTAFKILKFRIIENTFKRRLKYLFFSKRSDVLLICFSAFPSGNIRVYNNVKGFEDINVDRLYINDTFGYKGSYYLYENGDDYPYELTLSFLKEFIEQHDYKYIVTAGTSKGGSCAIMFGLKIKADFMIAGACQYHLGTYLNVPDRYKVFEGMMGAGASTEEEEKLNNVIPQIIKESQNVNSTIYLLYSKQEHTYEEDIKDLIVDLKIYNINLVEKEEFFTEHGDVGYYFIPFVKSIIDEITHQ